MTATPPRAGMGLRLVLLLAAPAGTWALARFDVLPHLSLCLFQRFTGRPCPGCGMTRAILRLSQGDVAGSLRVHPLGIALAAAYLAVLAGTAVGLVRGGDPVAGFLERRGVQFTIALVAAFVLVWVLRAFVVPEWAPEPAGR
jgi:hypothetical protein